MFSTILETLNNNNIFYRPQGKVEVTFLIFNDSFEDKIDNAVVCQTNKLISLLIDILIRLR